MKAVIALLSQALQQDCRQWSTGLLRSVATAMLLLVLIAINHGSPATATGLGFASWLMWLDYGGITLAAFSWFSSAIAEEREQGTLGLLRMTGVHSASILLGKWLPRVVIVQVLLIIQIPLAVLAITMGGVNIHQLLAAYIGLMAYAVMMSTVGLLWSTVCSRSRRASSLAIYCWLLHVSGPPLCKLFAPNGLLSQWTPGFLAPLLRGRTLAFLDSLHHMSFFRRMGWVLIMEDTEALIEFQVISNLVIGIAAFSLAWIVFERITLYNLDTPPKVPLRITKALRRRSKAAGKRPKQVGRTWGWALAWKEFYFVSGGWTWIFIKMLIYPLISLTILGAAATHGMSASDAWNQMGGMLMSVGGIGGCVEAAGMSGRIFGAEVHGKTIGELSTLPLTVFRIGYEKVAGCLVALLPAALTFGAGYLMDTNSGSRIFSEFFTGAGLAGVVSYLVFIHICTYVSIHFRVGGLLVAFFLFWLIFISLTLLRTLVRGLDADVVQLGIIVMGVALCGFLQFRIARDISRKGAQ